jgi:amino acid adenylation domain-containing protein/FkbM family methyltransferase
MGETLAVDYGERRMRYRELEERSNNLANFLIASGASKGSLVAILAEDRAEVMTAIIATLKARCVFVPLDPNLPEIRLATMMAEAPVAWFITESKLVPRIPLTSGARVICVDSGNVPDVGRSDLRLLKEYAGYRNIERPRLASHPDDMCYVYFTSGSTGRPKGIAGRLKAIDHFVKWEIETFGIREGTRVSQLTSPSFDAYLRDIFVPLCAGGTVCGLNGAWTSLDVKSLTDWINRQGINLLHCVPSLFRSILSFGLKPDHFSSLRLVLLAGEPVSPSDVRKWTEVFGDRIQLVNMYGPSETTMTKLFYRINPSDANRRSIPIGKPMLGAKAMIVGADGKVCPPSTVGEIYIRTPYRSLGYYNRPELTSEVFIPNPFTGNPDDLIYKTGDLGRVLEDGNFEFLGRRDQQVKIRGVRVELREIEELLLEHEMVKDVAVIDRDDESGNSYLCAYVVFAGEGEAEAPALRDYLAARLPESLVPSAFVSMDSLPRTITGKIDRRALPSIGQAREAAGRVDIGPRTPVEEVLAAIWSQVLNLGKVGIEENFFDIGGHSLMATQVISRVKAAFDVELPLQALFEAPTLGGLAEKVESALKEGHKTTAPPVNRVERGERMPLSYAQQRLWFIDQFEPGNAIYNIPGAMRLEGMLNLEILERVINEIIRRHEVLRTRFEVDAGEPAQVIDEWQPRRLEVEDLTGLGPAVKEAEAIRIAGVEAETGFDLSRGPLLRVKVLKMEEEGHILLYTLHHIVSDGWSTGILTREVSALYQAYSAGEPSPLEELPLQYVDFAVWQRTWLEGEALERQLEYWRGQLKDLPTLELPTDHPRPAAQSFRGARCFSQIDPGLSQRLQKLSRAEGMTVFMTLLTAFQALLARYSGQQDLAIGTVIANRNRLETEGMIGFFVNQLILRADFSGVRSFREALSRTRQIVLESYSHQDLPFEQLVEELAPKRDPSRSPLCQVVFALQNTPRENLELSELRLSPFGVESKTARWDLTLNMTQSHEDLVGIWEYCRDLFEEETIRRMMGHFQTLLQSAVSNPESRISELEILPPAEREQILVEWNRTESGYAQKRCAHELFEAQAMLTPEAVAIVYEGQELSYGELNRRANQLAHHLMRWGVGPETVIGLYLERSPEMMIGLLGILKAGGAYLPLNPRYPLERVAYMMADSQVPLLLRRAGTAERLPGAKAQVICLDSDWETIAQEREENPATGTTGENPAYVIYTSGSTGQPKGVMVSHRGLCNLVEQQLPAFEVEPSDRALQFASLSFDASIFETFLAWGSGAILCLADEERLRPGAELYELLRSNAVSVVTLPPAVLSTLDAATEQGVRGVRKVISAGEECSSQIVERWAGDRRFFNAYGPTEATVWATLAECKTGQWRKPPIGRPIGRAQVYVLDEGWQPAPVGVSGELHLGGAGLARGYVGKPELTAEKFIPHPFSAEAGARLYRTGDLARYLPDGNLGFLGRTDHQMKLRGYRIEPGEIDAVLAEHSRVKQCAVILQEDEPGQKRLVAYIVSKDWYESPPGAYLLPKGLAVAQQNKNETEFLYSKIFERQQYLQHDIEVGEDSCVFDVGANIGLFTLFIGERRPTTKIYAFEPIEDIYLSLAQNASRYGERVKVFQHGLSDREREGRFIYYPRFSAMSRLEEYSTEEEDKELVKRRLMNEQRRGVAGSEELLSQADELLESRFEWQTRTCRMRRLSDVMREQGVERINLLKIDVERAEEEVLRGIEEEDWEKIDQIVLEVHDEDGAGRTGRAQEVAAWLERQGYVVETEEDERLKGAGLYNLYARRAGLDSKRKSQPAAPTHHPSMASGEVTAAELREHLQRRLPEYMTPSVFVALKELPLTPNGKVDRKRLPAMADARRSMERSLVAPRDLLEFQLTQIWENVLDVRPVGVTDNFFDLGGHSLLAVRLMARIRQIMGQELPLSALFKGATIEKLASLLRREASSMSWSCLVELQGSGSQPPLFFVHPAGGTVICYLELARCLGPDRPFYGLQTPGFYGEQPLYTSVEELAAHYIEALKTVQPEGPYLLGGWSLGGIIAYEMAQRLVAQGQRVSQLFLLDCNAPGQSDGGAEGDEGEEKSLKENEENGGILAGDEALQIIELFGEALPISREELDQFEGDERIGYVMRTALDLNLLPPDIDVAQVRLLLAVFKTNARAMRRYLPQVYPGAVTLLKTTEQTAASPYSEPSPDEQVANTTQDSTRGWRDLAAGGVRVIDIPGEHRTIVNNPHVETLALRIGECLVEDGRQSSADGSQPVANN